MGKKMKNKQSQTMMKNVMFFCLALIFAFFARSEVQAYCVNGTEIKMLPGETYTITPGQEVVQWKSSLPGVATIDSSGTVTAVVANTAPAVITGTHSDGTSETYNVTVVDPIVTVTSKTVEQKDWVRISFASGYKRSQVECSIEDTSIAEISSGFPNDTYITVKGLCEGETNLIIKTDVKTFTIKIKVDSCFYFDESEYLIERGALKNLYLPSGFESYVWAIADPEIASLEVGSGSSVQNQRTVVARKAGETEITVTNELGQTAKTTIVVTATPLTVDDNTENYYTIGVGKKKEIKLTTPYDWNNCTNVIDNPSIASLTTNTSYRATIKAENPGDTVLTVTNQYGESVKNHIHVCKELTSVVPSQERYLVYLGSTGKIEYTSAPEDANNNIIFNIGWGDDCISVSEDGTITPKSVGTVSVFLRDELRSCSEYVYVDVKSPYFNKSSFTAHRNTGFKISLTGGRTDTVWTSSNPSVASVDSKGYVRALKAGTAKISANSGGYVISASVTVRNPYLSASSVSIYPKKTAQLKITGGTGTVRWTSSNVNVAKVSSTGLITSVNPGTATITASVSGVKLYCKVTVKPPTLSAKSKTLVTRQTYKLSVIGGSGKISWKSSNKKIATVSSKGVVTGVKTGTAVISAKVNGKTLKCKIKVKPNQISYSVNKDAENYSYGEPHCVVSKAYYSGKSLVLEVWVMNARMFRASKFDRLTFYVYDYNGKVIAKKKFTNIPLGIAPYGSKKIKLKFSGSSLKKKNAILNKGIDYDYTYYYTYKY